MFRIALVSVIALLQTGEPSPVARLDTDHEPFVKAFRASDGRARLVTLLSPT